jgi:hypothetical protein
MNMLYFFMIMIMEIDLIKLVYFLCYFMFEQDNLLLILFIHIIDNHIIDIDIDIIAL